MEAVLLFKKGSAIFHEGAFEKWMYKVESGAVGIYQNYGTPEQKELGIITEGFVGEMGIINEKPRTATAVALEDTNLTKLMKAELYDMFIENPIYIYWMMEQLADRVRTTNYRYMDVCVKIREHEGIKERDDVHAPVEKIVRKEYKEGVQTCKAGEILIYEGADEDWMYELKKGAVAVYKAYGTPFEEKIAEIREDIVGEMSILERRTRAATVVALEDCEYEMVTYDSLQDFIMSHPDRAFQVLRTLAQRLRDIDKEFAEASAVLDSLKKDTEKTSVLTAAIKKFSSIFR